MAISCSSSKPDESPHLILVQVHRATQSVPWFLEFHRLSEVIHVVFESYDMPLGRLGQFGDHYSARSGAPRAFPSSRIGSGSSRSIFLEVVVQVPRPVLAHSFVSDEPSIEVIIAGSSLVPVGILCQQGTKIYLIFSQYPRPVEQIMEYGYRPVTLFSSSALIHNTLRNSMI